MKLTTRSASILFYAFSAAFCLAAPATHAQTHAPTGNQAASAQDATEITRLYRLSDRATDAQDAATSASQVSADYVFIGPQGDRHLRAEVLFTLRANYTQMRAMGFHTQTTSHVKSIRVTGDHAAVLYSQHQLLRHSSRTLAQDATGEDMWVHAPGGWRVAQTRVLTHRQDKPTTSLLSPQELAALNTLTLVRNQAAFQNVQDSVSLFNGARAIDQSINDASSQQIHDEQERQRHRELYGY